MPLETVSRIADLVATNPPGSDQASTLDDHIRLIKTAVRSLICAVPGAATTQSIEISGGAVTPSTSATITLVPEGGSGADTLDTLTLTNVPEGGLLILRVGGTSTPITVVESATINLKDNESCILDNSLACLILQRRSGVAHELIRLSGQVSPTVYIGRLSGANTSYDFLLPNGYNYARFNIRNVVPDGTSTGLLVRLSQDNGVSYLGGTTDYRYVNTWVASGVSGETGADGSSIRITRAETLTTAVTGELTVYYASGTTYLHSTLWRRSSSLSQTVTHTFASLLANSNPTNAIRFLFVSANISGGILYGHAYR
jgi:hypothetical protein